MAGLAVGVKNAPVGERGAGATGGQRIRLTGCNLGWPGRYVVKSRGGGSSHRGAKNKGSGVWRGASKGREAFEFREERECRVPADNNVERTKEKWDEAGSGGSSRYTEQRPGGDGNPWGRGDILGGRVPGGRDGSWT